MTPREFARFVGENMGRYLYVPKSWVDRSVWTVLPPLGDENTQSTDWLYAENTEGDLEWRELPEVEG
jgi:hypothetical protein